LRWRNDVVDQKHYPNTTMTLDPHMTIKELLEHHPTSIKVFIKRKMLCVGCPTEDYHTLEDVAKIYGFTLGTLMESLQEAIQTAMHGSTSVKFTERSREDDTGLGK